MRRVLRAFALLGGSVLCGLIPSQTVQAADLEPVVEEPARFDWYVSLFGGRKWGDGDVDLIWRRHVDCPPQSACPVDREGELHSEVEDGWLVGGAIGTQLSENIWADIEVSHARLDTETDVEERLLGVDQSVLNTAVDSDEDKLRELFVLANLWFGLPLSGIFSTYLGGGLGVAHVDAELGFKPSLVDGKLSSDIPSVSMEADGWSFAYQLGVGLLIGLSENVLTDIGYRLKVIPNVDLDDPVFCDGDECDPPVVEFDADNDFDILEHVAQIGLTIGF
jgi:opacity protein-like surface antigen